MAERWKIVALCLNLTFLAVLTGCNRSGEGGGATTASIGSANGTSPLEGMTSKSGLRRADMDSQHPLVQIETSLGNITVQLDAVNAPLTVENFLSYVNAGQYDQTLVHQIYQGQGFLAGGYGLNWLERPSRTPIRNEANNGLKNRRGTIAMVRRPDAIDSATCQFFINVADNATLDFHDRTAEGYGYCVFGEVKEGLDIVDAIGRAAVHNTAEFDRTPVSPIAVKAIRQVR
ncbi:MAG: peptidylprolyl isomerase [Thermoguttaceae bacterium]